MKRLPKNVIARLEELELAKDYLNSDYYWNRKKELEGKETVKPESIEESMEDEMNLKYGNLFTSDGNSSLPNYFENKQV